MIGRLLYPLGVALLLGACQDTGGAQGPPPAFSPAVQAYFEQYMEKVNPTVFVVSTDGRSATYYYCPDTADVCVRSVEATHKARMDCETKSGGVPCKVYALGRRIKWKGEKGSGEPQSSPTQPLSSTADSRICQLAVSSEFGVELGGPRIVTGWEVQAAYREHVHEAWRRDLTLESCAKILGLKSAERKEPPAEEPKKASPEGGDIEERLRTLKALFDKGLITKEEYDKKRAEILEAL